MSKDKPKLKAETDAKLLALEVISSGALASSRSIIASIFK
jgi:hypothetical protein